MKAVIILAAFSASTGALALDHQLLDPVSVSDPANHTENHSLLPRGASTKKEEEQDPSPGRFQDWKWGDTTCDPSKHHKSINRTEYEMAVTMIRMARGDLEKEGLHSAVSGRTVAFACSAGTPNPMSPEALNEAERRLDKACGSDTPGIVEVSSNGLRFGREVVGAVICEKCSTNKMGKNYRVRPKDAFVDGQFLPAQYFHEP